MDNTYWVCGVNGHGDYVRHGPYRNYEDAETERKQCVVGLGAGRYDGGHLGIFRCPAGAYAPSRGPEHPDRGSVTLGEAVLELRADASQVDAVLNGLADRLGAAAEALRS